MTAKEIITDIKKLADPVAAEKVARFFKTGIGQYSEKDTFLGLNSAAIKNIAKKYKNLPATELNILIKSPYHEARSTALAIMTLQYPKNKQTIFDLYMNNLEYVNNWDLVDLSAPKILGTFAYEFNDYAPIFKLAESGNLWRERIAIVSNWYIIKQKKYDVIEKLAVKFIGHKHDLIHKATGWMLREMGKMNEETLRKFLDKYAAQMPRTALRYSLEKLPQSVRKFYMNAK